MTLVLHVDRLWSGEPVEERLQVEIALGAAGEHLVVEVDAPFHGDPPPPGPPGPTPGLWRHEVVEVFIAGAGAPRHVEYLEIELSPHGHHLALRLVGVRRVVAEGLELDFRSTIVSGPGAAAGRWRGEALVPRSWLPPPPHRVAATAVHGTGRSRRHLASIPLPGERPDFHQPHLFPRMELP